MSYKNYCYEAPYQNTLKNKAGIKDYEELEKWLSEKTSFRRNQIRELPLPAKLDSNYLKQIHQYIFQDGFEWAGVTRDIHFKLSDGTTASMPTMYKSGARYPFLDGSKIQEELAKLDQNLAQNNYLQGLSREEFTAEAAKLLAHLNYIHPFREGNGRTQRTFIQKIAQQAGHKIKFSVVTAERMVLVSIAARERENLEPMQHMFEDISNPQKTAALKEFLDAMKSRGVMEEINERNVVAPRDGIEYQGTLFGIGNKSFVMTHRNIDIIVGNKEDLTEQQLALKSGDAITFIKPLSEEKILLQLEYNLAKAQENMDKATATQKEDYYQSNKLNNKINIAAGELRRFKANPAKFIKAKQEELAEQQSESRGRGR